MGGFACSLVESEIILSFGYCLAPGFWSLSFSNSQIVACRRHCFVKLQPQLFSDLSEMARDHCYAHEHEAKRRAWSEMMERERVRRLVRVLGQEAFHPRPTVAHRQLRLDQMFAR